MAQVEIYGQSYNLKGGGDSAYLADLATYVDARMNQIADATATVDSLKVAILTALNIADEYHQLKRESEKNRMDLAVRAAEWERMLDGALKD
jgi:cell division protein ZapA